MVKTMWSRCECNTHVCVCAVLGEGRIKEGDREHPVTEPNVQVLIDFLWYLRKSGVDSS